MSVTTRLLTAEDLDQFPDDGKRREIIAGELYVRPAPSIAHQELASDLHYVFYLAVVLPDGDGFTLLQSTYVFQRTIKCNLTCL